MSRVVLIGLIGVVLVLAGLLAFFALGHKAVAPPPPQGPMPGARPGPVPASPPAPGGGPGGQEKAGGGPGGGGGLARMIEQAGGTEEDSKKVTAWFEKRQAASTELREALTKLREISSDEKATDEQAAKALADFQKVRDKSKADLEADRKTLAKELNLASRPKLEAALTVIGVLDNGGGMGRMGRGGQG
jgi:hypothetical protein